VRNKTANFYEQVFANVVDGVANFVDVARAGNRYVGGYTCP
jgi:hypothetical protein